MDTDADTIEALVKAFNAELIDSKRNRIVGDEGIKNLRFELYHAGFSVCSQKVRSVLAEKGATYLSHELSILNSRGIYSDKLTPAENYFPNYVRLRLIGGKSLGKGLAKGYSARSSVETEGFDACVVPTLVDHKKGKVIVDSKVICQYLDEEIVGATRLIPEEPSMKQAVLEQVSIVDTFPQPGLLYGAHPKDDRRPDFIIKAMATSYDLKIEALECLMEENRADPELVEAYTSKLSKEKSAQRMLADQRNVVEIYAEAQRITNELEQHLTVHAKPWICGSQFTMADIAWGINLYRMQWLGMASLWQGLPNVQQYARLVYHRPSIWKSVIRFPSPMPESPHTRDIKVPDWAA